MRHELLGIAQEPAVADRAPDEKTQHVAAIGIRGIDAVGDQEGHGAGVVGDDPPAHELFARREGRIVGRRLRRDQIGEQIGLVHRRETVGHGKHALEAGAGIDVLRGQFGERAVGGTIVLLEHEVPNLDVPVAQVGTRVTGPERILRARVVEDLRARPARARRTHRPEVVFVPARDARGYETDLGFPQPLCVVVRDMNGNVEPARIELHHAGEKLPSPHDRLALVVVAEREVPEHLEERTVAAGPADVLDVAFRARDAQAALDAHRTGRGRGYVAQKGGDERLHPRDGEERRRHRVGDQGSRGDVLVLPGGEEVDEGLAEFLGFHSRPIRFGAGAPDPSPPGIVRYFSWRTFRNFSSAFCWRRETCICETLRRLAISVCETDS